MKCCRLVLITVVVLTVLIRSATAGSFVMTENQIKEDIKFLSQSMPDGAKPSRLRALLLADLKRALPMETANCSANADLTLTTPRCSCATFACPRSPNYGKRSSRIQRSCADYCCRRAFVVGVQKSISATASVVADNADRCEIAKPDDVTDLGGNNGTATAAAAAPPSLMPGIVQIFAGKSKAPLCLGTLVHARVVMTTLVCATTQLNDRMRIKVRETVDRYQHSYQVRNVTRRIYPRNYAELYRQFGFNMALLELAEPVHLGGQTRTACWARAPFGQTADVKRGVRCYVDSLENKHGRTVERREPVTVYPVEQCRQRFAEQQRGQMFFPKSSMCAGRPDGTDIEIFQNGAPLQCIHETATGFRYVQHGMLSWSAQINRSPHLFANVSNYRNWMDKQLAEVLSVL